jgi:RNA recognition motif. (a.k.a. RRM, RBD, or RNP domain)
MTDRETGRSRGFGFVEMPDGQAAHSAMDALNGTSLAGRGPHGQRSAAARTGAGSPASHAGKPLWAAAAHRDGAPLVRAQRCPGTAFSQTLIGRACPGAPCTPGMRVHDDVVPPCRALGG